MTTIASVTTSPEGVQIVANDAPLQLHYFLTLTWDEVVALAREKGKAVTTQEMAKMSRRGIQDIMEGI